MPQFYAPVFVLIDTDNPDAAVQAVADICAYTKGESFNLAPQVPTDRQPVPTGLYPDQMSGYKITIRQARKDAPTPGAWESDADLCGGREPDEVTIVECEDLASAAVLSFVASTGEIVWRNPACKDAAEFLPGALLMVRALVDDTAFQVASV